MGVPGLLQGLKSFVKKGNVRDYHDQSVAVDLSSWLHKSVYSIADTYVEETMVATATETMATSANATALEVKQQRRQQQQRPVPKEAAKAAAASSSSRSLQVSSQYVIQRCHELLQCARVAKIYLVMDGKRCPMKAVTNEERENRRQDNLAQARAYRNNGEREKAFEKYKSCIRVSSEHAAAVSRQVEQAFANDRRIEIVQSPYEADAQLVQLVLEGSVHAVITEDSDVLVYQAACRIPFPVLFKLDRYTGSCDVLSLDWLFLDSSFSGNGLSAPWKLQHDNPQHNSHCGNNNNGKKLTVFDAVLQTLADRERRDPGLGSRLFVQSCVLAGCDYSPNLLSGVGLVGAFKHVRQSVHRPDGDRFRHVLQQLPARARLGIAFNKIEYEELLAKSEAVFYRHIVRRSNSDDGTGGEGRLAFLGDHPLSLASSHSHRPKMDRFGGDWTFLGDVACVDDGRVVPVEPCRSENDMRKTQGPTVPQKALGEIRRAAAAKCKTALTTVHNPYGGGVLNARKSRTQHPQQPLPSSLAAHRHHRYREPLAPIFAAGNAGVANYEPSGTIGGPPNPERSDPARGCSNSGNDDPDSTFSKYFCSAPHNNSNENVLHRSHDGNPRLVERSTFDDNPLLQEGPVRSMHTKEHPQDDLSIEEVDLKSPRLVGERPESDDDLPVDPFLSMCKIYKGDPRFVKRTSLDGQPRPAPAGFVGPNAVQGQVRPPSADLKARRESSRSTGSHYPPLHEQVAIENDPAGDVRQEDEPDGIHLALHCDDGEQNRSTAFTYSSSLSASAATYDASKNPRSRSFASKGSGLASTMPLAVLQSSRRSLDPALIGSATRAICHHSSEGGSSIEQLAPDWPSRCRRLGANFDLEGHGCSVLDHELRQSDILAVSRLHTNAPNFAEPPYVSLDSADLAVTQPLDPSSPSPTRSARPFQYYDEDFMCSPDPANLPSNEDDGIVDEPSPMPPQESSSASNPSGLPRLASGPRFNPMPLSTIGPAKTVRPALHAAHHSQPPLRQDVGLKRFLPQRRDDVPQQNVGLKRFLPQRRAHASGPPEQYLGLKRFLSQRPSGAPKRSTSLASSRFCRSPKRRRRSRSRSLSGSPRTSGSDGSSRPINHYFARR